MQTSCTEAACEPSVGGGSGVVTYEVEVFRRRALRLIDSLQRTAQRIHAAMQRPSFSATSCCCTERTELWRNVKKITKRVEMLRELHQLISLHYPDALGSAVHSTADAETPSKHRSVTLRSPSSTLVEGKELAALLRSIQSAATEYSRVESHVMSMLCKAGSDK